MSEVSVINQEGEEEQQLELPPGFRFHPTDEEVVTHYLTRKALNYLFTCLVIADVDLNKCEPWDLPGRAKMGEKEWFFFCHKDRKYPTGMRTNRATASGYWKATGKDKEIFRGPGVLVGMKKTLVFYLGRAPSGNKTPWVMHEYRLEGKLPPNLPRAAKDEWAVCRVFNKDLAAKPGQQAAASPAAAGMERNNSFAFLDDFLLHTTELPPLMDSPLADGDLIYFKGSGANMAGTSSGGHQVVKTEQQPAAQNPSPSLLPDPYSYFSLPATSNPGVHSQPQAAGGEQLPAIPRECKVEAPAVPGEAGADMASSSRPLYLDDLFADIPDYSNMWKF